MALAICKSCGHEQGYQAQRGPKLRTIRCAQCGKPALRRSLNKDLFQRFARTQGPIRRAREAQRHRAVESRAAVDAEHRAPVLVTCQVKAPPKKHKLTEEVLDGAIDFAVGELADNGHKPAVKQAWTRSLELEAERVEIERTSSQAVLALANSAKKHLRKLASAASAQAEVSRAVADGLGEITKQLQKLYMALDCIGAVLINVRDLLKPAITEHAVGQQATSMANARTDNNVFHSPIEGDALVMTSGDTLKVLARNALDLTVEITPAEEGPTREIHISLGSWQVMFREAVKYVVAGAVDAQCGSGVDNE